MDTSTFTQFDTQAFRHVLGHYPIGVTIVTAIDTDGTPVGMTVGSFTSVSLQPPLVAFLPDKSSTSFPRIRSAKAFCVNVLGADQQKLCQLFATKTADKFRGIAWRPASSGAPIFENVVAWIDCDLETIHEEGDHYFVIGRVRDLAVEKGSLPLVFFRGGYGRFSPHWLVAAPEPDLVQYTQIADLARRPMERLATDLDLLCVAHVVVGDDLVTLASAITPRAKIQPALGVHIPFVPPMGMLFMAWSEPEAVEAWFNRSPTPLDADARARYQQALELVRRRGLLTRNSPPFNEFDVLLARIMTEGPTLESSRRLLELIDQLGPQFGAAYPDAAQTYDPRSIAAPVFDPAGTVVLMLSLYDLPPGLTVATIEDYREHLGAAAEAVTKALAGHRPN